MPVETGAAKDETGIPPTNLKNPPNCGNDAIRQGAAGHYAGRRGMLKLPVAAGPQRRFWVILLGIALTVSCSGPTAAEEYRTTLRCADCPRLPVSRVIDGDTFHAPTGRVRLFGVDTPERGRRCYTAARRSLEHLAGRVVRVEAGPRREDSGGRLLYYVYTDAGNSIDEILVRQGLARAWRRDGQHRDLLLKMEREARRESAGCLW